MNGDMVVGITSVVLFGITGLLGFLGKRYFDSVISGVSSLIETSKEERNAQHDVIKSDVTEIKEDIKELNDKVGAQNGRIGKIEGWKELHLKIDEYSLKDFNKSIEEIKNQLRDSALSFSKAPRAKRKLKKS